MRVEPALSIISHIYTKTMTLFINDKPKIIDIETLNVPELLDRLNIPHNGTAVAVNGRLATHCAWADTELHDNDKLTIISAAYGG